MDGDVKRASRSDDFLTVRIPFVLINVDRQSSVGFPSTIGSVISTIELKQIAYRSSGKSFYLASSGFVFLAFQTFFANKFRNSIESAKA